MSDDAKVSIARAKQGQETKTRNARELLLSKKRRTKTVKFGIGDDVIEMTFQALSAHELDALTSKHPPTAEQKVNGMVFNVDTFAPALVHACLVEPDLELDEVKAMWSSEDWSSGELATLFSTASDLCMDRLNIPFSGGV